MTDLEVGQAITQALTAAQAFQAVAAEYEDLPERILEAKHQLANVEASLRKARTDLRVANDALAKARAANTRKHRSEEEEKLAELRNLDAQIGEAHAELDRLAQATREAQLRHNGLLGEIDTPKSKLGV